MLYVGPAWQWHSISAELSRVTIASLTLIHYADGVMIISWHDAGCFRTVTDSFWLGKGYSHRRGANKDNFFIIRTAEVLHGGANKKNFPVIHTAAVRIRNLSQLFAPR